MTVPPGRDPIALLHALEVHRAELELQNHELRAVNDELRRSNRALETARDHFLALHHLAPIAFVTLDRSGHIVNTNQSAEKLFRRSSAQLFERRLAVFVDEAARPTFAQAIHELFSTGYLRGAETRIVLDDGVRPVDVIIDGVVLYDQEVHAVLAILDVTTQKRAVYEHDRQIRAVEESRRRDDVRAFAGGVAHHINNYLAEMLGGTEVALADLADRPSDEGVVDILSEVRRAAIAAGALMQRVLASSGTSVAPKVPCTLSTIVEAVVARLGTALEIQVSLATDLPGLVADPGQLQLLLTCVITNAAEAMEGRPGAIRINATAATLTSDIVDALPTTLAPGRYIVLDVRDAGSGMDAVTLSRCFDPYFSTKSSVRGLGLVAVRGIVHGHAGAITIESTVGLGTRVRMYLPAAKHSVHAAPSRTRATLGSLSLLVVDDAPEIRVSMSRALTRYGHRVTVADSGAAAIEAVGLGAFDLIFMDLTMPGMNGVETARALRALGVTAPIVVVSGYGTIPDVDPGLFDGSLPKPFAISELRDLLARLFTTDASEPA